MQHFMKVVLKNGTLAALLWNKISQITETHLLYNQNYGWRVPVAERMQRMS